MSIDKALFGVAGLPDNFTGKSSIELPQWLEGIGLTAFEYQCGRGVRVSADGAAALKEAAAAHGIVLSLHSPYFINVASPDIEGQQKSLGYISESLNAAMLMGASRVVVHMGSPGGGTRVDGIANSKRFIAEALKMSDERGYGDVSICLETMGKINQLGTLEETISVCAVDERLLPAVDFGHLNARHCGEQILKGVAFADVKEFTAADYESIISKLINKLGFDRVKNLHCHFSKIEYTKGGEKRHLNFADSGYGPDFVPLAEAFVKYNIYPQVICESRGMQDIDAISMRDQFIYALNKGE